MKLHLLQSPHAVLSAHAAKVNVFDAKLRRTIDTMEKILISCKDPEGVGLAAPQVGLSQQIFLMKPTHKSHTRVFLNPSIVNFSDEHPIVQDTEDMLEGCLSVKNVWAHVDRSPTVTITFQDVHGTQYTETFSNFESLIVQHEIDHLQGVLFTKRALEQGKILYRMEKKNGKETFEEIEL